MAFLGQPIRRAPSTLARTVRFVVARRNKSIFPPNISSLKELGRLQSSYPQAHPELFNKMKSFYQNIPKGPKQASAAKTFWGRYYENYIAKDSFVPVLHFIGLMVPVGFYISYYKGGHYHPRFEFH
ncbi:uncharacterized protein BJ171DRAFT_501210 [Polychytrium aggregatum]|uniref:uncharacterized protein n=1 Tax=Polychytrium aggregatum TaxID=110093 RepID=UPI0022FE7F5D|nr:uncharacterized protein BJ171DRAFT_501210 [Polychytrium aggregatum]KAI9205701.1 hypothetical protein BJ171DRAFT_501210 [Polychytrium aggregatum]